MFNIAATCSHFSLSLKTGVVPEDFVDLKLFLCLKQMIYNILTTIDLYLFCHVSQKFWKKYFLFHLDSNSILYKHQYGFRKKKKKKKTYGFTSPD